MIEEKSSRYRAYATSSSSTTSELIVSEIIPNDSNRNPKNPITNIMSASTSTHFTTFGAICVGLMSVLIAKILGLSESPHSDTMIINAHPEYPSNGTCFVHDTFWHSFDPFKYGGCRLQLQSGRSVDISQPKLGCSEVTSSSSYARTFICPGPPPDHTTPDLPPSLNLYMVTDNATYAEVFNTTITDASRIVAGNPRDAELINGLDDNTASDTKFNIIIDHVDHSVNQQVTSLEHL
ncbi:hypothetical protein FSARC_9181 [Fusarium sarcochroum]|uniref:Uncharacterized protein n=1 Tax=Fusarium sarcochroum TaxID=1208366 RepID=A0A8H4TRI0_9HYPO|nr:hypothetical protein FSARC_9181 [Fusarium sarcochroum]